MALDLTSTVIVVIYYMYSMALDLTSTVIVVIYYIKGGGAGPAGPVLAGPLFTAENEIHNN